MKKIVMAFILMISGSLMFASGIERYAVYVGSNNGGDSRNQLLYAGSDAENFQETMEEIGGVNKCNSILLLEPSPKEVEKTLQKVSEKISREKDSSVRSEFVFYYSGHSDEEGLLLGGAKFDYSALKEAITEVPSDIHVVILDSCYSGNFIRTKGGQKVKPFLSDDSSVVKGHAYLSSSSENEYSQESDEIKASFFTNSIITGLKGAADTSGDKRVTLNELYTYAFNETLVSTEDTEAGPQHPNYNITLVGSGDLILSDLTEEKPASSQDNTKKNIVQDSNKTKSGDEKIKYVTVIKPFTWTIPMEMQVGMNAAVNYDCLGQDDIYYMRDDMKIPSGSSFEFDFKAGFKAFEKCSFFAGCLFDIDRLKYSTSETQYEYSFSPTAGVYVNVLDSLPMEGIYFNIYPAYKMISWATEGPSSYYDYKMAEEAGINALIFGNMSVALYIRGIQYFKDSAMKNTFDAGCCFNLYVPSRQNWDKVSSRKIIQEKNKARKGR